MEENSCRGYVSGCMKVRGGGPHMEGGDGIIYINHVWITSCGVEGGYLGGFST